tara:strand:+ start:76 stop:978 length:903 start_codon:yes stop_codon:yes gene_type:complete
MGILKKTLASDEVDLKIIFLNLWKEKYLFLSLTLIFVFFSYLYSLTLNKNVEFTSRIQVKDPPLEFFSNYEAFFIETRIPFKKESFTKTIDSNLLSLDNIENFVNQNNDLNDFKNHLKESDQTIRLFFEPRFQQSKIIRDSEIILEKGKFLLTTPSLFDANKFLDNYIIYVKDLTLSQFRNQKIIQVHNILKIYEQNLEISNAISLDNPIIQNYEGVTQSNILTEPGDSFYQGSIILSKRIEHLNEMLEILKKKTDYNPIAERAIVIDSNSKNTTFPIIFGLIIGMLFSFSVILFKSILD